MRALGSVVESIACASQMLGGPSLPVVCIHLRMRESMRPLPRMALLPKIGLGRSTMDGTDRTGNLNIRWNRDANGRVDELYSTCIK